MIYCIASRAAVNLLYSDRAFTGLLSLNLTSLLESELALLKWIILIPNSILSLKLNPGQWKVSENIVKNLVNDDTEIEAVPAVFTRPLTLGLAPWKLHAVILTMSLFS